MGKGDYETVPRYSRIASFDQNLGILRKVGKRKKGERLILFRLGNGKPSSTHLRVLLIIIIPQKANTKLAQCSSIPIAARGWIKPKGSPGPFPPDVT